MIMTKTNKQSVSSNKLLVSGFLNLVSGIFTTELSLGEGQLALSK